jgi:uncharacterized protein (DUF2236 family)
LFVSLKRILSLVNFLAKIILIFSLLAGISSYASPAASQAGCETALTPAEVARQSQVSAQEFESTLDQIQASLKDPKVGVFGPQSMMWKVFRERALLVGLARMGIMQMADPRVSEIMLSSSKFSRQPIVRMENTVHFLKTLVYGDWQSARKMSNAIFKIHQRVQNEHLVGARELDELMLWVHASTWDSVLLAYQTLVGELTASEVEQFYSETKTFGLMLGLSKPAIPATYADFRAYMDKKSATLVLSEQTKAYIQEILGNNEVLKQVLPPNWPIDLDRTKRAIVSGAVVLLPESIKGQMAVDGQPWVTSLLKAGFSLSPYIMPLLPERIRFSRAYLAAVSGVDQTGGVKPRCPFHEFFKKK